LIRTGHSGITSWANKEAKVGRHLAIGDIHGCFNALTTLVDHVGLRPDDTIVTLGDYVDRGPNSAAVLDFIIELSRTHNLVPLRGNHEIMMLDSRQKQSWFHAWLNYGGDATLISYTGGSFDAAAFESIPDTHIDFLENKLLPYYECESHFFVHAYADEKRALADQKDATMYWRRYGDPGLHCSGKIMVCGHTIQKTGLPASNDASICIDTWAYGEGWLSCLDVESGDVWQANEEGDARRFTLVDLEKGLVSKIDPQN
jgi:serine/threonine protein phosphatase 1